MIILGIETSCDETGLSLIKTEGVGENLHFTILGNELISQAKIHEQYGGVFPVIAKREHGKNLIPLFLKIISTLDSSQKKDTPEYKIDAIESILERETELKEIFLRTIVSIGKPPIDTIAVTTGPGLEPALWVGVCFARALGVLFDIPVIPINHMEGHIFSALMKESAGASLPEFELHEIKYPALALLISGGHTELVLMRKWQKYEIVGKTRDDAVGEAFDKVARILGLPYPGGPQISALAEKARNFKFEVQENEEKIRLPRPMIHSKDFDFSFSGLKTAVLYLVKKIEILTPETKMIIAKEFEDAITEVLISKTEAVMEEFGIETLILGGGVIANTHVRKSFLALGKKRSVPVYIPPMEYTTDNGLMIALAGALKNENKTGDIKTIEAKGNLTFTYVGSYQ